jgi:hypothetical protein
MLEVQKYLRNGKTLDDLVSEFAIRVTAHPDFPNIAILNYDQIESRPKTHPIIKECRALVLDTRTFDIAARSFPRFFNFGEAPEEIKDFDFSNFIVQEKCDGSLCLIFFFEGHWHANTRGSFAVDPIATGVNMTWREAFCKAMGITTLSELDGELDRSITYVAEFCSPFNKIVRRYEQPTMYLLTTFRQHEELPIEETEAWTERWPVFKKATRYNFRSIEEIQDFLLEQSKNDPTFEGVVIRDRQNLRSKIKNPKYLALHAMRGESDNLFHPKHLLPFIMDGGDDELLLYFNEVRPQFFELKSKVQDAYIDLLETWVEHKDIEDQKTFAMAVKSNRFSSVLFETRKQHGSKQTVKDLKKQWREVQPQILKFLLGK